VSHVIEHLQSVAPPECLAAQLDLPIKVIIHSCSSLIIRIKIDSKPNRIDRKQKSIIRNALISLANIECTIDVLLK
jgi:hypothetical protein